MRDALPAAVDNAERRERDEKESRDLAAQIRFKVHHLSRRIHFTAFLKDEATVKKEVAEKKKEEVKNEAQEVQTTVTESTHTESPSTTQEMSASSEPRRRRVRRTERQLATSALPAAQRQGTSHYATVLNVLIVLVLLAIAALVLRRFAMHSESLDVDQGMQCVAKLSPSSLCSVYRRSER